jgi:hypothetical protein
VWPKATPQQEQTFWPTAKNKTCSCLSTVGA